MKTARPEYEDVIRKGLSKDEVVEEERNYLMERN